MKLTSGLAAVALAATTTVIVAAPSNAAQTAGDRAVSAGSTWLTGQLTDGILHNDEYDYDDLGLSADIAFALDAVGGQDATVDQIVGAIEPDVESWVTAGTPSRVYAGSVAKMVSVVQAAGQDPTAFHGEDQVDRLEVLVAASAPLTGRLEDTGVDPDVSWDADFVNVIGQSFAVRALTTAGSERAADATTFLLDQQCDDGSFRAALTQDKTATEQGCAAGVTGEVDTTALTVLNILATPDAPVAAKGAAYLAANWLKTQQASDGSFSAGSLGVNTNTTGLAGWALAEAGQDAAATKAAGWLRGVQVADLAPCATALTADNGAMAYTPADLTTIRGAGSFSVPQRELSRRASAQALPALASLPAGSDVAITVPATAVEKSTVTVTVTGLGEGEPGCVSFGSESRKVTGTSSPVQVTFTLPAGAATHTFRVATLTGSSTATTAATAVPAAPAPTPTMPPAPAEPTVGDLAVAKVVKVGRKGVFKVEVACDSTEDCAGKVKVRTVGKVARPNGTKKVLLLAKSAYDVEAGGTAKVRLTLTKPARAAVGSKRIRVVATQTADGAGSARTKFWLRRK